MFTIILLSIGLPVLAGTAYLALRNRRPQFLADVRGVALQTVIVIVVLLAIAGAVAGVLVSRGGEAVESLQEADVGTEVARAETKTACDLAGGKWTEGATDTNSDGDKHDKGEGTCGP